VTNPQVEVEFYKQMESAELAVNFTVPAQGITAIFGRSGAGKTTIINAISGLLVPDRGKININGMTLYDSQDKRNVAVEKRNVGYVFQESRLFPHFSVQRNLNYGVKKPDNLYFEEIVGLLDLKELLNRYPRDLSGGEKQRVAIGRALLSKPDILLMDEPLASLDLPRKREVMPFLEKLAQRICIPILYVSHSLNEILRLADHLVVIDKGRVVACGGIEDVWSSQVMRPWQSFHEQSSLFSAQIAKHNLEYGLTQLKFREGLTFWVQQISAEPGSNVRLQIRANDVSISLEKYDNTSIRNILPVRIVAIEHQHDGADKKSVNLKLDMKGGCYLWATITRWALDELKLCEGMDVYAQIKGVSVSQKDVALTGYQSQ